MSYDLLYDPLALRVVTVMREGESWLMSSTLLPQEPANLTAALRMTHGMPRAMMNSSKFSVLTSLQ